MLVSGEMLKGKVARSLGIAALAGAAFFSTYHALADTQVSQQPIPITEPLKPPTDRLGQIDLGYHLRTVTDSQMLDNTYPGIDLTYFGNEAVSKIRAIANPQERIMSAIGFLDVEHSGRYNRNDNVYTCNVYALDLLRLILRNDVIGSRYNILTGEPAVLGANDIDWGNTESVKAYDKLNLFLDSNNTSEWMELYGTKKFGWNRITDLKQLEELLKTGQYIGLAATSMEYMKIHPDHTGHMAVMASDTQGNIGFSQSTINRSFRPAEKNNDPILKSKESEFAFYLHSIPSAPNP